MKDWAEANEVPDDAIVEFQPGRPHSGAPPMPVRDLDQAEAEEAYESTGPDDPGEPATPAAFVLREHYDG